MELVLVRHAEAEEKKEGMTDLDRRLTSAGRRQARVVGERLAAILGTVDVLITSEAIRAKETADEILKFLKARKREVSSSLNPGADVRDVRNVLRGVRGTAKKVVLVGHEPDISKAAASLIGDGRARLKVKKLGCVIVDLSVEEGPELVALLQPDVLM